MFSDREPSAPPAPRSYSRGARRRRACLRVAAGFTPLLLARGPARAVPARARLRRADVLERVVVVAAGVRERLVRARVHLPRGPSTSSGAASPEEKEAARVRTAARARARARRTAARRPRTTRRARARQRATTRRRPRGPQRGSSPRSRSTSSLTCADRRPVRWLNLCYARVGRGVTPGRETARQPARDSTSPGCGEREGSLRSAVSRHVAAPRAVRCWSRAPPVTARPRRSASAARERFG